MSLSLAFSAECVSVILVLVAAQKASLPLATWNKYLASVCFIGCCFIPFLALKKKRKRKLFSLAYVS